MYYTYKRFAITAYGELKEVIYPIKTQKFDDGYSYVRVKASGDSGLRDTYDGTMAYQLMPITQIVAESDDLPSLFGKIIIVGKTKKIVSKYEYAKKSKEDLLKIIESGKEIYGAIWVEGKGGPLLKSVARLNSNGDWKLL